MQMARERLGSKRFRLVLTLLVYVSVPLAVDAPGWASCVVIGS